MRRAWRKVSAVRHPDKIPETEVLQRAEVRFLPAPAPTPERMTAVDLEAPRGARRATSCLLLDLHEYQCRPRLGLLQEEPLLPDLPGLG